MNFHILLDEWSKDSVIDPARLEDEILRLSKTHAKYLRLYGNTSIALRALTNTFNQLRHEKYIFYTQGPTVETQQKGWKLPPQGKILKNEVDMYLAVDPDLVTLQTQIDNLKLCKELLESILKNIATMGYNIKAAIDLRKIEML